LDALHSRLSYAVVDRLGHILSDKEPAILQGRRAIADLQRATTNDDGVTTPWSLSGDVGAAAAAVVRIVLHPNGHSAKVVVSHNAHRMAWVDDVKMRRFKKVQNIMRAGGSDKLCV
jgi:hypothetical protein